MAENELKTDEIEIAGIQIPIYPDDFEQKERREYRITGYQVEQTQWGAKGIFHLLGLTDNVQYTLSSWNMAMAQKTKLNAVSVIGRKMILEQLSEKRLKVAIVD